MLRAIVTLVASTGQTLHLDFSTAHDAVTVNVQVDRARDQLCKLLPGVRLADVILAALGRANHVEGLPEFCQCAPCIEARLDRMAVAIERQKFIGRPPGKKGDA
jgi:hypothetical protein